MKNKKIISIFIAVLISAILLFTQSKSAIRHYSHGQDIQISNLFQHLQYSPELGSQQLLAKQKYSLTFLAQYNNLGTVEFLFSNNNLKQNTNDTIWFRIKEIGSKNWQYQEQYSTSQFNPEKYFSFGFPVIPDSQNTEYLIEIESISGTSQNSISLNQNERQYTAKYAYTKSYLRKNPHVIPFFVKNKLQNYVSYLPNSEMAGILITSILPLLACLLILKNQNSKQLLREMFSYGNNPPITKEQTYISLFLLSIYWIIAIVTVIFFTSGHTESSEWQVYIASSILVFTQIAFIAYFQRYLTSKIYKLLVLLGCFLIFLLTVYLSFVLNLLNYNYLILLTSYLAFLIFQAKKNSKSFLGILLIQLLFVIAVTSYFFLDMNDIPLLALFSIILLSFILPRVYQLLSVKISPKNPFIAIVLLLLTLVITIYSTNKKIDYHHFSFYVGPAYEIQQGKSILSDVPSQYGYLSIQFISSILEPIGISFENFHVLNQSLFIIYYILIFLIIHRITRNNYLSFVATIIAVLFQTQFSRYAFVLGPATGPLRFGFGIIILFLLTYFPKKISMPVSAILAAISIFWSIETGIYVVPAYLFALLTYSFTKYSNFNQALKIFIHNLSIFLLSSAGIAGYVFIMETRHHQGFPPLNNYLQFANAYKDGWVSLLAPIFGNYYLAIIIMVAGFVLVAWQIRSRETNLISQLSFIAIHNLAIFSYFVSRSHYNNIVNISLFYLIECIIILQVISFKKSINIYYKFPVSLFIVTFLYISFSSTYHPYSRHVLNQDIEKYLHDYQTLQDKYSLAQDNTLILSGIADTPIITEYRLKTLLPLNPSLMTSILSNYQKRYLFPNLTAIGIDTNIVTTDDTPDLVSYLEQYFVLQPIPIDSDSIFALYKIIDIKQMYNQD